MVVVFSSGGHVATMLATHYHLGKKDATYPERDWVKSNHKEFFAGVTTRYHGTKTEREALVQRDQILAKFLLKIWGKPKSFIDSPPLGPQQGK